MVNAKFFRSVDGNALNGAFWGFDAKIYERIAFERPGTKSIRIGQGKWDMLRNFSIKAKKQATFGLAKSNYCKKICNCITIRF